MQKPTHDGMPRKVIVVFFLIDTSGSMAGTRIGAVNSAIEETLVIIRDMNDTNPDAVVEVALMTFDSGAEWLTQNGPVKPENYFFQHLSVGGLTAMGEAFRLLEEKLHKSSGWMNNASGSGAPIIFLMSDGEPNDQDWESKLTALKNNKWFGASGKVALAVGDDADTSVLERFTGTPEAVVKYSDGDSPSKLAAMIKFIAVRSTQIASGDFGSTPATMQDVITDTLNDAKDDDNWDLSGDGW